MKRIVGIVAAFCMLFSIFVWLLPAKPRLVSCITTMDTAYLTIIADRPRDKQRLEELILQMCKEDAFEGMKLYTEERKLAKRLSISVYASKKALEQGNSYMEIRKEAEE